MKTPELSQFARAARSIPDDDRVPYAFEKRVMACLRGGKAADAWAAWGAMMWRAALSCFAITLLTTAVVRYTASSKTELFAGDLERTVLAPVDVDETW